MTLVAAGALVVLALADPASTSAIDVDPRVNSVENPFACLGGYESLTGAGRSLDEMEDELRALLGRIAEDRGAPARGPQRAVDLCVAGRLKARLGQGDAAEYLERAIAAAPREPGFELFAGMYWAGMRGARRPLLERAERHFYAASRKLERLRARRATLAFHDTVDDWLHKQLLVLYQQDGAQLLPWKAYHQDGGGLWAPGLAFSHPAAGRPGHARLLLQQRDAPVHRRGRLRRQRPARRPRLRRRATPGTSPAPPGASRPPTACACATTCWARWTPSTSTRSRRTARSATSTIPTRPTPTSPCSSWAWATSARSRCTRCSTCGWPGGFRQGRRQGVVEFEPQAIEHFRQYEAQPQLLALHRRQHPDPGPQLRAAGFPAAAGRRRRRSPAPPGHPGGAAGVRAVRPAGAAVAGGRASSAGSAAPPGAGTSTPAPSTIASAGGCTPWSAQELYAGTRFAGAGRFDSTLQGTYYRSNTEKLNPNLDPPGLFSEPGLDFASGRASLITQLRLIDQEAIPGVPPVVAGLRRRHAEPGVPGARRPRAGRPPRLRERPRRQRAVAEAVRHRPGRRRRPGHRGLRLPVLPPPGQGPAPRARRRCAWAGAGCETRFRAAAAGRRWPATGSRREAAPGCTAPARPGGRPGSRRWRSPDPGCSRSRCTGACCR